MDAFKLILRPGVNANLWNRHGDKATGSLYVVVEYKAKNDGKMCLSITGTEGPTSDGDAKGSSGQCIEALDRLTGFAEGWDAEKAAQLKAIWEKWHLNDMHAGCTHQDAWDKAEMLEVPEYGYGPNYRKFDEDILTGNVKNFAEYQEKVRLKKLQNDVILSGGVFRDSMGKVEAAKYVPELVEHGLIAIKEPKRERAGWVYPKDHFKGLLTKKCDQCESVYGGPWQYREVPDDVLETLKSFPLSDRAHPWRSA